MIKGCDISKWQGVVNFQSLKDNFDFVIIRSTYGDGYTDEKFAVNRDGLRNVGVLLGFYHYAYPQYNTAQAEADWFTKIVSCKPGETLVLDCEESYPDLVNWCKAFLDRVTSNMGFKPLIYLNQNQIKTNNWSTVINAGYGLWLAQYDYNPDGVPAVTPWPFVAMRQYSNQGNVAGINPLDLNVFYGTKEQFQAYGNPAPVVPTPPPTILTPDQYFGKYDTKGVDYDGFYGYQCVDNYRQFCKESLNVPQSPGVEGAYQIWTTYLTDYFDRVESTPTNCPIKGDIVIWGQSVGQYGHVAIAKDGTALEFTSFDQNWPVGSLCHFQKHNYNGVLGWLRKKAPVTPPPPTTPTEPPTVPQEPPTTPIPPVIPPMTDCETKLANIKITIQGKGWWWTKYAKIKSILAV